jgi:homoserine O-succinyltransferase/O-acetyltransferase
MPLLMDRSRSSTAAGSRTRDGITIGLINNMPDPALEATERQFVDLIRAATGNVSAELLLYAIPEVQRADLTRREMAGRYRDVSELWDAQIDGLIVTGTEPRTKNLKDEPYWRTLARVVDWARDNTSSTIWSCLAAHAAVLHADGIERRALPEKLFGVFDCDPAAPHPMTFDTTIGAAAGLRAPHSRYNDLPEAALAACGYRILTRSALAGVDMFVRQDKSFHLFLQGHPEYEAATLLREYRRDVGRYLRHERDSYPALPYGYFTDEAVAAANRFRERATADRREHLVAAFPVSALGVGLDSPWRPCATAMYAKWVQFLAGRKAERRPRGTVLRRAFRDWPAFPARPAADGTAG